MIDRIRLTGVWVHDQNAAYDFYVNKLGFAVQSDIKIDDDNRWLEVIPQGVANNQGATAFAVSKPYPGQAAQIGGFAGIVFATSDIASTYQNLDAKGVHFVETPTMQVWGGMQALFSDPDGNIFALVERED